MPHKICSVENCDRSTVARGWCNMHWSRWKRHGDPTGGGTAWGEPMRYLKEEVLPHTGDECLVWPYSTIPGGYGKIRVEGKTLLVSRVVCEAAHGPAPSPAHEVAHSCGKGQEACCTPNHLRWATHTENMADELIHGTRHRGQRNGLSKLTEENVRDIRKLNGKLSNKEIGARFGVSGTSIWQIFQGRSWSWVQ